MNKFLCFNIVGGYLNIINQANKYVYIFTPYLIIDHNVLNFLILAVRRGSDVRIVIPAISDKKVVYNVTESYVDTLVSELVVKKKSCKFKSFSQSILRLFSPLM